MAKMTRKELRTLILEQATRGSGEAQPNSPTSFLDSELARDVLVHLWTEVLNNRQKKEIGEFMFERAREIGTPDSVVTGLRAFYMASLKAARKDRWRKFFRLK